jgi:hypothetical protein
VGVAETVGRAVPVGGTFCLPAFCLAGHAYVDCLHFRQ